jgi:hypothetical protein
MRALQSIPQTLSRRCRAAVQVAPPKITLNWQPDQYGANSYTVYRKAAADRTWPLRIGP